MSLTGSGVQQRNGSTNTSLICQLCSVLRDEQSGGDDLWSGELVAATGGDRQGALSSCDT